MEIVVRNRQRSRRIAVGLLRDLAGSLVEVELGMPDASLAIHLVGARAMAGLNWRWLKHEGSTDILTFNLRSGPGPIQGELYICIDDAVSQSREFRTSPSLELVRYVVHGVLHLCGYDDLEPGARRRMKRVESRLVRRLAERFPVQRLVGGGRSRDPAAPAEARKSTKSR